MMVRFGNRFRVFFSLEYLECLHLIWAVRSAGSLIKKLFLRSSLEWLLFWNGNIQNLEMLGKSLIFHIVSFPLQCCLFFLNPSSTSHPKSSPKVDLLALVTTELCISTLVSTGLQTVKHSESSFIIVFQVWLPQAENIESVAQIL